MPSVAEAFETPEFFAFKEYVSKGGVDNSIKVKNNNVMYGKSGKEVPAFRSVDYVKEKLLTQRTTLLLQLNDLLDKIVVADHPEVYKVQYEGLVKAIETIDAKFDEINAFIEHQTEIMVQEPLNALIQEIENNKVKAQGIIKGVSEDVHVDKSKIKALLTLHKANMSLSYKLAEAQSAVEMDYVIWPEEKPTKKTNVDKSSALLDTIGMETSKRTKLSSAKKLSIKNNVKQLMKERL
jgi:hypothetical protein